VGLISRIRNPRPDITKREIADRSGAEILALTRHYGHELRGMIYFYDDSKVLAAPQSGRPGDIHVELAEPIVENEPVATARMGYMALDTLLRYRPKKVSDRARRKVTEWPALKASGADSEKAFLRATIGIALTSRHGTIELEAASMINPERRFAVRSWAPASITHADMGTLLQQLIKGAKVIQQAGLV
jgi:hypothetical protein